MQERYNGITRKSTFGCLIAEGDFLIDVDVTPVWGRETEKYDFGNMVGGFPEKWGRFVFPLKRKRRIYQFRYFNEEAKEKADGI